MIYSNACGYAIQALAQLAMIRPDGYVLLDDLCKDNDLPRHFVAKIFQDLVRKGLLVSAKGRGGGFALSKPPAKITLYDIVSVIDGVNQFDQCVVGMAICNNDQLCPQHDEVQSIREHIKQFLMTTTLERMSSSLHHKFELIGRKIPQPSTRSKAL